MRGLYLPATFHPQGLVTLAVACSLQGLAGFVSRRQRSWEVPSELSPLKKLSERFRTDQLTYRFTQRLLRRKCVGPVQWVAVPELCLLRVPCGRICV